ncbi:sensor histidine kinase [Janibacter corallicola]|uniref:sensor histidine kinase n=1 Tax=Janibacter corallicola TaxID=415212 RepID=UPI000AC1136C|nr:HAMP domain-containing sensor histidine kinase [Janibacter corallicola]
MRRLSESVVRRLEAVPLTWRLIVILLSLLLAALTITSTVTAYLLQRDLVANIDDQLVAVAEPVAQTSLDEGFTNTRGGSELPSNYAFVYMPVDSDHGWTRNPTGEPLQPALPKILPDDKRVRTGKPFTVSSANGDMKWRFVAGAVDDGSATVAVGVPLRGVQSTVHRMAIAATSMGLLAVIACGVLGWFATRRAFRPLRRIEDTAAAIAAGDLARRVPVRHSRDEVASLSESINSMLGQVERSFRVQEASEVKMRQFVADASHELRTPLATVRGYAELYRQGAAGDLEQIGQIMGRIEGEAARMSGLVEDLLTLARLDDERPLEITTVDLLVLAGDAVHDARVRVPERDIHLVPLEEELTPETVRGDDARLRQVLSNLIGNALMHTTQDVPIEVAAGRVGDEAVLEVRDHGPGVDPRIAERVFERFYRADKARSRARGGSGLGLAIVTAIVEQHQGTVSLHPTPGGGATFRVSLPAIDVDSSRDG